MLTYCIMDYRTLAAICGIEGFPLLNNTSNAEILNCFKSTIACICKS